VARRLLADGHDVWLAARDPAKGQAAAEELGARFVALDVTRDASVAAAAERVAADGGLDVLVNNAGIVGARKPPAEMTPDDVRLVFETNVFGIVRVTRAFLPLLERSTSPVIVNVSSGMGSLAVTSDPSRLESTLVSLAYPASKAAVNMLTTQYAKAFPQMRINAVDPGYTATDFNDNRGTKPVGQGAEIIVRMAKLDGSGPTGNYLDENGVVPW
jgi:NAD(P)-dependent dehydrogenase (short-subunit alcohol dehydrogenase family)